MLVAVALIFLLCHSLRCFVNLYESLTVDGLIDLNWAEAVNRLSEVSHLALVFNSSVNMVVYLVMDRRFRLALWKTLRCADLPCENDDDDDDLDLEGQQGVEMRSKEEETTVLMTTTNTITTISEDVLN